MSFARRLSPALRSLCASHPSPSFCRAATTPAAVRFGARSSRALHTLPPFPSEYEHGIQPFLSRRAVDIIAREWQGGLLERLNDEVRGTELEDASVAETVIAAAQDRSKALMFNYASQALNNSFFLTNLSPEPKELRPPSSTNGARTASGRNLLQAIEHTYDSLPNFKSALSATAMGMSGSGWVWLVMDQERRLGIVATYGAGTVLVQSREQRGGKAVGGLGEIVELKEDAAPQDQDVSQPPPKSSSAASPSTPNPPSGIRTFSTRASSPPLSSSTLSRPLSTSSAASQGLRPVSSLFSDSPSGASPAPPVTTGDVLYPLFNVSVHEHAWMHDYGVWGKEEYLVNFWKNLDWSKVENVWMKYSGSA